MSNYPPMVNDDHDHFTDTNEYDDEEPTAEQLYGKYHDWSVELLGTPWPSSAAEAATFEYEDAHRLRIR